MAEQKAKKYVVYQGVGEQRVAREVSEAGLKELKALAADPNNTVPLTVAVGDSYLPLTARFDVTQVDEVGREIGRRELGPYGLAQLVNLTKNIPNNTMALRATNKTGAARDEVLITPEGRVHTVPKEQRKDTPQIPSWEAAVRGVASSVTAGGSDELYALGKAGWDAATSDTEFSTALDKHLKEQQLRESEAADQHNIIYGASYFAPMLAGAFIPKLGAPGVAGLANKLVGTATKPISSAVSAAKQTLGEIPQTLQTIGKTVEGALVGGTAAGIERAVNSTGSPIQSLVSGEWEKARSEAGKVFEDVEEGVESGALLGGVAARIGEGVKNLLPTAQGAQTAVNKLRTSAIAPKSMLKKPAAMQNLVRSVKYLDDTTDVLKRATPGGLEEAIEARIEETGKKIGKIVDTPGLKTVPAPTLVDPMFQQTIPLHAKPAEYLDDYVAYLQKQFAPEEMEALKSSNLLVALHDAVEYATGPAGNAARAQANDLLRLVGKANTASNLLRIAEVAGRVARAKNNAAPEQQVGQIVRSHIMEALESHLDDISKTENLPALRDLNREFASLRVVSDAMYSNSTFNKSAMAAMVPSPFVSAASRVAGLDPTAAAVIGSIDAARRAMSTSGGKLATARGIDAMGGILGGALPERVGAAVAGAGPTFVGMPHIQTIEEQNKALDMSSVEGLKNYFVINAATTTPDLKETVSKIDLLPQEEQQKEWSKVKQALVETNQVKNIKGGWESMINGRIFSNRDKAAARGIIDRLNLPASEKATMLTEIHTNGTLPEFLIDRK